MSIPPLSIHSLTQVLNLTNLTSNEQIKENSNIINHYKKLPKYSEYLLHIIMDKTNQIQDDIKLNASIQLKNIIRQYWKFNEGKDNSSLIFNEEKPITIISNEDKHFIRYNIFDAIFLSINMDNIRIMKQLNQCIKHILNFDFETIINFKEILSKKISEFFKSNYPKNVYCGIIILYQLSKIYEFENNERKKIYIDFFLSNSINSSLLNIFSQCSDINNETQAMFANKIIKIYFKNLTHGTNLNLIYFENSIQNFDKFLSLCIFIIQTLINNNNVIVWKSKYISYKLIESILKKFFKNVQNKKINNEIENYIYNDLSEKIYKTLKTIYINVKETPKYANTQCKCLLYKIFTFFIYKRHELICQDILLLFINNNEMLMQCVYDSMITEENINLFFSDPKAYINNSIEIDNNYGTIRNSTYHLLYAIMQYKENNNKCLFFNLYELLTDILSNNEKDVIVENENLSNLLKQNKNSLSDISFIKHSLIKESILFILQNVNSLLIKFSNKTKVTIENLLEKYIITSFQSSCPFLIERACTFIELLRDYYIQNENLVISITKNICNLLEKNDYLPIRIMSGLAAPTLLRYNKVQVLLKGNVKILLSLYIKIMNEIETEEIIECVGEIVKYFKKEVREYIVQLSDYLINYFIKINKESQNDNDNDEEDKGFNIITISNQIIQTMGEIIRIFISDEDIYSKIINHINIILSYCINCDYYSIGRLEDGLDLLNDILVSSSNSQKNIFIIHKSLWMFYINMLNTVIGSPQERKEFKSQFSFDKIYEGYGVDYINDICKIMSYYIYKDGNTFLNGRDNNNLSYYEYTIEFISIVFDLCEKKKSLADIYSIVKFSNLIFELFRGKVDLLYKSYIDNFDGKFSSNEKNILFVNSRYKNIITECISSLIIYNPNYISSFNNIIIFWLNNIEKCTTKKQYKINLISLCSFLLNINEQKINDEIIKQVILLIYSLLSKFNAPSTSNTSETKKKQIINTNNNLDDEREEDLNDKVDELIDFYNDIHNNNDNEQLEEDDYLDDDEENLSNDYEEDNEFPTEISKQNEINCAKKSFELLNNQSVEKIKIICGEELLQKLNNIIVNSSQSNI